MNMERMNKMEKMRMNMMRMNTKNYPTSIHVAKAIWMGAGSSSLPKKGTWHKWINETFVFIKALINSNF